MRTTLLTGLLVALVLPALGGCGTEDRAGDPASSRSTPAVTTDAPATDVVWEGPTIPDGDYRTVLDQRDKARWKVTQSDEELEWGPSGRLESVLRIRGDQWSQAADYGGGPLTVGASGTLSYDERGRLLMQEACCGRGRFTWTLEDGRLELAADLAFAEQEHPGFDPTNPDVREWLLMSSGPFRRVPGTP